MSNDRTATEIQRGQWMVAPHMLHSYLKSVIDLINRPKTMADSKEAQGAMVREVIDPDGNFVNISQDDIPQDSVGVVRCVGPMFKYGGWWFYGTDELLAFARELDEHPNIIGQIWHDDSGGGLVSSVAPYLDFLENKQKPVVALVDLCASANLYKNCGTDFLMAENNISSMIGSIGTMMHFYSFQKMLEEMGITEHEIYSNFSKDKNKPFQLAYEGKYDLIKKEMLDPLAVKFQDDVKARRKNLVADVPGLLTGKMFYAEEALDYGLIDGIGSMEAAIDRVKFLASARSFITLSNV